MDVQLLNGFNSVTPMNGFNSVVPMNGFNSVVPMNGFNSVTPMNGFNSVVPMQGSGGRVYYVAPVSLMDIGDVPDDWFPTDLTDEEVLLLKTAYIMGDQRAMNGLFASILKPAIKIGSAIGNTVQKRINNVIASTIKDPEKKEVFQDMSAAVNQNILSKLNPELAAKEAAKEAERKAIMAFPGEAAKIKEAADVAANATKELLKIGILPSPEVLADKAIMSVDAFPTKAGTTGGGFSIAQWWANRSTTEKWVIGGGTALLVGGTVYYFYNKKGKKGRRKK